MESKEIEKNQLFKIVYKFLDKIENILPNELSCECNQIKQATKKIIATECSKERHYLNVFDDPPQQNSHDSTQFNPLHTCGIKQTNIQSFFNGARRQVSVCKKTIETKEDGHQLALEKNQFKTSIFRANSDAMIHRKTSAKDPEYTNMQFCDPKLYPKCHDSQTPTPSFLRCEDKHRTQREPDYQFTNDDVTLTLMSPPKESNYSFPNQDSAHLYGNQNYQ